MEFIINITLLIARVLLSSLYLWAGWAKVTNYKGTIDYMKSRHFPFVTIMLPLAIAVQLLGSLSIIFGVYARLGALALIGFTIAAAFSMHNFWAFQEPTRTLEKTFFMKDLAILGGLILLMLFGPGQFAIMSY